MAEQNVTESEFHAFVFPVLALILGLILDEMNKRISFLGIPDSVLQFLIALFASFAFHKFLPAQTLVELTDKYSWTSLHPETLLMVLLPPLLFESSFKINSHLFFSKIYLITSLTVVAYYGTLLIASAIMLPLLTQTVHLKRSGVFLFTSIIAATDPVAVVSILEQYGAPHRLRILIEGESLLNDGLALFTYRVLASLLEVELGFAKYVKIRKLVFVLFMSIIGSLVMGATGARVVAWIISKLQQNKKKQAFILVSVYGMFMLCETCSASPALGLVVFGVMLSSYREMFAPETTEMALELWAAMGYWANNVIFIFAGFSVGLEIFSRSEHNVYRQIHGSSYFEIDMEDMAVIVEGMLLSPIPLFARIASIYLFYKFYGLLSSQPIPPRTDFTILAYAGLRGALGLILAMELRNVLGGEPTKKILLLTCSTTFVCLVFQGMTFSSFATREGSTKRSKYVKDTCVRLCRFLDVKVREAIRVMELDYSSHLNGTNWNVVKVQTSECLGKHTTAMEREMLQQQDDELLETSDEEGSDKESKGDRQDTDTRIGFYGILLARVHDSWSHGALSGPTAHIIIAILEHGIDEGQITVRDIEHHLKVSQPSLVDIVLYKVSEYLFMWIGYESCINRLAQIGSCPLLTSQRTDTLQYVTSRPFEKWWMFQTGIMCLYCILIAHVNYDEATDKTRAIVYIFLMAIWIMNVTQTLYIVHKNSIRSKGLSSSSSLTKDVSPGEYRNHVSFLNRLLSKETLPAIISCLLMTGAFVLSIIILNEGYCIRGEQSDSAKCQWLRSTTFALLVISTLYSLTIAAPLFIVMLREYSIERQLMQARIRLSALHFLHHLVASLKISPDLFCSSAYKTARREAMSFDKVIDGLMRLELKENAAEIDVVPVIKTRQAVRMMSYQLENILNVLKIEGFMPPDSKEKWGEVVAELRESADGILWVPQVSFEDSLEGVWWIRSLRESSKQTVINLLIKALSVAQVRRFTSGTIIKIGGKRIWFLKKGICKITEWLPLQARRHYHEIHISQGSFVGERNILKTKWKGPLLPLMWPKRRYETTTFCEMVEINEKAIADIIAVEPSIYTVISNKVQAARLITELRHSYRKRQDITMESFWTTFESCGTILNREKQLKVPEGRIGIIGCWTQITLVAPRTALDSRLHVRGPAKLWVKPADSRAPGMVHFEKVRYEDSAEHAGDNTSCISFVHDGPGVRVHF
nr:Cation H+ exchanger domain containing protein [Haemonchus contortus]